MPRYINKKNRLLTSERAVRASKQRPIGNVGWFDPFGAVGGTLPEKMVYAELSRRNIRFAFQNEVNFAIPEINFNKNYRPDIIIPDLKLIIEVQGSYWHSTEEAIKSDSFKFAVYQILGWKVLAWWDFDILDNLQSLFSSEPLLHLHSPIMYGAGSTEYVYTKKIIRDDTKGIATLNRKRAQRVAYKKEAGRIKPNSKKKYTPTSFF